MNIFFPIMDAYRSFARKHPVIFTAINIILASVWITVIMMFSGENADKSGSRSAEIIVTLANALVPSADITINNYDSIELLDNMESVLRKIAHMTEYGILAAFVWAALFGIKRLSRKYAYVIPVLCVAILGAFDEKNQTTVTGRYGSWVDVCIDALGAVIVVFVIYRLTARYRLMKRNRRAFRTGTWHIGEDT